MRLGTSPVMQPNKIKAIKKALLNMSKQIKISLDYRIP
jgi:hypothetical protein